jgi:hypothetical protein
MPKLTDIQKNFLFEHFFKNDQYAGARNIMDSLLEDGRCIVPDYHNGKPIWIGGVGNFIKTKEAPDTVGCITYVFDFNKFINSEMFNNVLSFEKIILMKEYRQLKELIDGLDGLSLIGFVNSNHTQ